MNTKPDTAIYREYLWPSVNTLLAIAIVFPTVWLTIYPFDRTTGLWAGIAVTLALYLFAFATAPRVVVTNSTLAVGRVSIPRSELGSAQALTGQDARIARTAALQPGAFAVFRGTTLKLVRVQISSSIDATPYWLFSSRRPEALVAALQPTT